MRGLEEIVMHNTHANGPAQLPDLSNGHVYTVIWSLFDDNGDHVKTYCTEVTLEPYWEMHTASMLEHAICGEGLSAMAFRDNAELDFILAGGSVVLYDGHAQAGKY